MKHFFCFINGISYRKDLSLHWFTYCKLYIVIHFYIFTVCSEKVLVNNFYALKLFDYYCYSWDVWLNFTTVITCPALTFPANVGIIVQPRHFNVSQPFSISGIGTQPTYHIGSEAFYSCDPGFNHSGGDLTRTCLSNGTWSGDPAMCTGKFPKYNKQRLLANSESLKFHLFG